MTGRLAPPRADLATGAALRRLFDEAGYTADRIQERLGTGDRALAEGPERPVHLRRLGDADALAVLVRVLMLDTVVPRAVAADRLSEEGLSLLERTGLVMSDGDEVDGTVRVVPHEHLLVASDRFSAGHPDHVAAVHGPSATLAHLTVRRPVGRALDVGTGNGIQALLASAHADHVVATDLNERAVAFAAFNASINRIENIEFRTGSFFEPAADETFDLVVSNPPYVISPESEFLFRDSGLPRDTVSESVVRDLPAHVAEGGFGSVMISWIPEQSDDTARPVSWLDGSGCDVLLVHTTTDPILDVASLWNRDSRSDPARYAAAVERWLEYFAANDITHIAFGCIVVRKRAPSAGLRNWARAIRMPGRRLETAGAQIERIFAAHDFLTGLTDPRELLEERLRVNDQVVVDQQLALVDGGWTVRESSIAITSGMRFSAGLDQLTSALVLGLDGSVTLRDALTRVGGSQSQEELEQVGVRVATAMLEAAFLERAST